MSVQSEIKACVENIYCLGGSRGNEDQRYLDNVTNHLIEISKQHFEDSEYVAYNNKTKTGILYPFTWIEDDQLIIDGEVVDKNDYTIIQIGIKSK